MNARPEIIRGGQINTDMFSTNEIGIFRKELLVAYAAGIRK